MNLITSKNFKHTEFPSHLYKSCERIDGTEIGRLYKTAEGKIFPSITTVLSIQEKPELDNWRAAVGDEEADRVSRTATTNGTHIHNMAEAYIKNASYDDLFKNANPLIRSRFLPLKKMLDKHVDNIFSTELKFYSNKLQVAGTTDLIAEFDGKLSIIDYKTSKRIKYPSEIKDYFIQSSVYAIMAYEMFGLEIRDIVIMMLVEGSHMIIFKEKVRNHIADYIELRKLFKEKYSI
jgi:ATP-dependent exoDNAse (exonuclease V) beta subunit